MSDGTKGYRNLVDMAEKIICKRCGKLDLKFAKNLCRNCYNTIHLTERKRTDAKYREKVKNRDKLWRQKNKEKYKFSIAKSMVKSLPKKQKIEVYLMLKKGLRGY
jgi:ribosomal protein L37E